MQDTDTLDDHSPFIVAYVLMWWVPILVLLAVMGMLWSGVSTTMVNISMAFASGVLMMHALTGISGYVTEKMGWEYTG